MPTAQTRNDSMQQLNSVDQLRIQDRNFSAEWIDSVGSGAYIAAITVPFATERLNTAPTVYSMASNILTVLEAGVYVFSFSVASSKAGSTEGSFYAFLQEDTATGTFADVIASTVYTTCFFAPGSVYNSLVLRVGFNYRYRVRSATHGVSFSTIPNGSRFSVIRLWQNG